MKTCFIHKIDACKIAIADISVIGGDHFITRINVPKEYRGARIGALLLQDILKEADKCDTDLYLQVYPSGGLSFNKLVKWYERHGFTFQESGYMFRPHHAKGVADA